MTREEGPERTQRTVAELLAKYGANSDESTPRRRRRRADDAEETAPQAIIDRVLSDSGEIPRVRDDDPLPAPTPPPPGRGERHSAPTTRHRPVPQPAPPPAQQPPPPPPPQAQSQPTPQPTQRQMPPVAPPERRAPERRQETRQTEQRRMPPQNSQPIPRPQPQPQQTSGGWPMPPAEPGGLAARLDGRQDSRADMRPVRNEPPVPPMHEGATEVMPRIPDEPPAPPPTGQYPAPHRVARTPQQSGALPQPPPPAYPQSEPEEPDYPTEYHGFDPVPAEATQYVQGLEDEEDDYPSSPGFSVEHDRPVGEDGEYADGDYPDGDEDEEHEKQSPLREWLSMAGQLAIGVVGGAALWLGFNWLWGKIPAAALVVALAVIVGLVWVVRKIRRADDLQTTILTVLVGLVVTVSPAAMLLLSR
jgi:hypothetical protein